MSSPIPWQKPASWSPRESLLRWRTVAILTLATQAALYLWLNSPLRYRELTVSAVACRKPAWWLFPAIPSDNLAPTFEESELYLPISTSASLQDNRSAPIQHRHAKISLLQSCTYPDVSNSYLRALLDNHREYCSHNNMEYLFRTGKGDVWKKIVFLAQKLETELSKPEKERIEWIL